MSSLYIRCLSLLGVLLGAIILTSCGKTPKATNLQAASTPEIAWQLIVSDDFAQELDSKKWVAEQMPGGSVSAANGVLAISDEDGCTVWLRQKLTAPVKISYDVTMSSDTRVSDLNCFWMASDPAHPDDLFFQNHTRTGKFSTYDSLNTYYVGYGGNANTTTRLRRYDGTGARPLLPQHDLSDAAHLLKPDHLYKITLITQNGETRFFCDGETVFTYKDPQPLTSGWFGFRTVKSKMLIKNFRVESIGNK